MTPAEREVFDRLVEAWNAFLLLPNEHADDNDEFRYSIHILQRQILARSARRELNKG